MAQPSSAMDAFTSFGEMLKYLRKRVRLTQRDLGIAVGYSETYITKLENGSRAPDVGSVKARFIEALNLQRQPEQAQWLIELAEAARGGRSDDSVSSHSAQPTPRQNNRPVQLTRFIGRERELAEVTRLLSTHRLVTLIGAGGVGKTRLAMEAAAEVIDQYPDGVWLITLASVTDPKIVANTVAAVFDLREIGQPLLTLLRDHLRDKHILIMLDNCEHLIHACAELTEALLGACPSLRILVTSREPMNIPGEMVWRVPSMVTDEAVQLFEARALEAIPESALTDDDTVTIAKICERLDGIPLAIELAASRLRVYSLAMIADRLDDRFKLLTGGARTALPRHQTLRALIDWSYGLLSPDEQRLLRYLSVFAGGWTLEAAESVGEGVDVLSVLPQLVNKSLVVAGERAGQRRYMMLETIRQFAAEKLIEHDEINEAHERAASYLEKLARLLGVNSFGVSGTQWKQVEAELDNVRGLIVWARTQADASVSLRLVVTLGEQFTWGYLAEPLAWLEEAMARGEQGGNVPVELRYFSIRLYLRQLFFNGHNLASQTTQADELIKLSEYVTDKEEAACALWPGMVAAYRHDFDRAITLYERGLKIQQSLPFGNGQGLSNFNWLMGLVCMQTGNPEEAATHFRECLRIGNAADNGSALFQGLSGFTWLNTREALTISRQVLNNLLLQEQSNTVVRAMQAYTQPLIIEGYYPQAENVLKECLDIWHRLGVRWDASLGSAQAMLDLGQIAWLQGDTTSAQAWYEQSLDEYSEVGDRERVARLHIYIGLTRLVQGDLEHAAKDFQIGLNLYRELEQPAGVALALTAHARLAEARGQMETAARLFGAASASQELTAVSILWPASPVIYQREIAEARKRFSETQWMGYWREGERMTHEQAIALVSTDSSR